MKRSNASRMRLAAALCTVAVVFLATQLMAQVTSLDPAKMPTIGTVDERFQSYNIEMVGSDRRKILETIREHHEQKHSAGGRPQEGFRSGRHRPEPLSVSSAHRSFKSAIAKTGRGVKPRVCAS